MLLSRFSSFWIYPLSSAVLVFLMPRWEPEREPEQLWLLGAGGLVLWSLLEYFLHRWVHWDSGIRGVNEWFERIHLHHHANPHDPNRMRVHPFYSLPVSVLFLGLLYLTVGSFVSAAAVIVGIWMGFLYYEWVHYRVHLSSADRGFIVYQRRLHFYHHFVNAKNCFGVTSPIWDLAWGTFGRIPRHRQGRFLSSDR